MTGAEPNPRQRELIDGTEGVYVVDAGAGTGKTFTVTRRYASIVEQDDVTPEDVLLVTFTSNAATEMKDRIVGHCQYGVRDLADAPIQTFHSLCLDVLQEHGHAAPTHLGIDDRVTLSTRLVENDLVEEALFREFVDQFVDAHPVYADSFRALDDPTELLDLVHQLAAKGVFPDDDGWYRNGERHLDGDLAAFRDVFADQNQPRNGGSKQSRLRSKLARYGSNKCYLPDAPEKSDIRGSGKQVPADVATRAFEEDREALKQFVHDVYYEYLEFALRRNYLNFGFLQLFAFVLLCENHALREDIAFEYVMVDEFQDSSEIQFKLALLLADTDNLCVVGDWKQSIYGFQYADVDNIREFESRLAAFGDQLNSDHDRVSVDADAASTLQLTENYRSTQKVLDFSTHALTVPASSTDDIDADAVRARVDGLNANTDNEHTTIEAIASEHEHEAILAKVWDVVGNDDYRVEGEDGDLRAPEYGDVAVLTRTRDFGHDLLQAADDHGIPVAYEGGVELFRTNPAKLLLAWLRILEDDADRGWVVVLEEAGYGLDEIDAILDRGDYPADMVAFVDVLRGLETVGGVAQRVFERYGCDGPTADVVVDTVQSVHDATAKTRGDLIRFIERGIDAGSTHEVSAGAGTDSVTVQTIHATKGLEYPIVVLANMNQGRFPPAGGGSSDITYEDPIGLRRRTVYDADAYGVPHVYDNWRADVLSTCLPRDYDEERRLLYVAVTRAESHVVFTAGSEPNTFLEELPVDVESVEPVLDDDPVEEYTQTTLQVQIPTPDGPVGYTPHTLMQDDVFEGVEGGRGTDFGSAVHDFAEAYADDEDVTPTNDDERHVAAFLDGLDGELLAEQDAHLPLTVDGDRVTISGIVDLVHVTRDAVDVVDYKTATGRYGEAEYRKQLSVYYHVASSVYPDREVSASIFYTEDDELQPIEPMSMRELEALVSDAKPSSEDVLEDRA